MLVGRFFENGWNILGKFSIEKSLLSSLNLPVSIAAIAVIELRKPSVLALTFVVAELYFVAIITPQLTF
jgi:hypothetical protein